MQFQKHEMKMRLAGKAGRAAVFCLCAGLVLGDPVKGFAWEQTEYVRRATGSNSARPKALNSTPSTAVATTSILNSRFARFSSPVPSVMATRALPPVPIIKPRQPSI